MRARVIVIGTILALCACGSADAGGGDTVGADPGPGLCAVKDDCAPKPCLAALCTDGACDWRPVADGVACEPGVCATGATCQGGACHFTPLDCDDHDPCTVDTCAAGACGHAPEPACECAKDADCPSSADLCAGTPSCNVVTRKCAAPVPIDCGTADDPCSPLECDPAAGECHGKPVPDGIECDPGDPCAGGACVAGACMKVPKYQASGPCKVAVCDAAGNLAGWSTAADGTSCHLDECTTDATCAGGVCQGKALSCDDGNPCTQDSCNPAIGCVSGLNPGLCDDGNPCTDDWCDPADGCHNPENTDSCDDGNACTLVDICHDGVCVGGPIQPEVCNGFDDDCNGQVDDGASDCTVYYTDWDADGYGVSGESECLCAPAKPFTATVGGDCNDTNAWSHPGVDDDCNGFDDDCDGVTDPEGAYGCKPWYLDADHDGHGTGASKCLCGGTGQYTATQADDCDDNDFDRHPGGHACGKDGDCDGALPDVGEPCDDGNAIATDGCDACVVVPFQATDEGARVGPLAASAIIGPVEGFVLAWGNRACSDASCAQFDPTRVRTRIFHEDTTPAGAAVPVGPAGEFDLVGTDSNADLQVAAFPDGAFVIAWRAVTSGIWQIRARRFSAAGAAVAPSFHVDLESTQEADEPRVAAFTDGRFVIAWTSRSSGTSRRVMVAVFDADGSLVGQFAVLDVAGVGDQSRPSLAVAWDDTFLVSWRQPASSGFDLLTSRFKADTTPQGHTVDVPGVSGGATEGAVAAFLTGGHGLAWTSGDSYAGTGAITAARWGADGKLAWLALPDSGTGGIAGAPRLATFLDDSVVVAWARSDHRPFFRRLDALGGPLGETQSPMPPGLPTADRFALVGGLDGQFLLAWGQQGGVAGTTHVDIQRYNADGTRRYR